MKSGRLLLLNPVIFNQNIIFALVCTPSSSAIEAKKNFTLKGIMDFRIAV